MFGNNSFGQPSFGAGSSTSFGTGFGSFPSLGAFGSQSQPTAQQAGPIGTTIRFVPLSGTDTVQKAGTSTGPSQITTRHQNISAMKEYESKSVDELRLEDYAANRKVGQPQTGFSATPFGSMQPTTSQQSTSIFGSSANQPAPNLFGSTPTQNQTTNLFGQSSNTSSIFNSSLNKPQTTVASSPFTLGTTFNANTSATGTQNTGFSPFSLGTTLNANTSTTGTQNTGFSLFNNNNTQTNSTPFGQSNVNSPFKTNMFSTPASTSGSIFNTTTNVTSQQQPGFSAAPFGTMQPPTSQQNTSIFGTSTNQSTPSLFGASQSQNQTTNIFGQTNNTSGLFNTMNKPQTTVASSPFSLGTTFNANTSATGTQNTGFSLFNNNNNNTQTNPAPFGQSNVNSPFKTNMFSTPASTAGSIFNTNTTVTGQQQPGFSATPFGSMQPTTSQQSTSIFGSSANQPAPSLFGATPAQNQPTNLFGQSSNTSSIFNSSLNKPQTTVASSPFSLGTNFNATTSAPAPQNTGFSLFNNNTQTNTLPFGQSNVNSPFKTNMFATPASTAGSIFNTTTNATGQQQPGFSAAPFGTMQPPTSQQSTSLFGSSANQSTTNLFGATPSQSQMPNLFGQSSNTSSIFNSSLSKPLTTVASSSFNLGTTFNSNISVHATQSTSCKIPAKTSPKLNMSPYAEKSSSSSVLFDGLDDNGADDLKCAIDVFVPKRNIKRLDLKPSSKSIDSDLDNQVSVSNN